MFSIIFKQFFNSWEKGLSIKMTGPNDSSNLNLKSLLVFVKNEIFWVIFWRICWNNENVLNSTKMLLIPAAEKKLSRQDMFFIYSLSAMRYHCKQTKNSQQRADPEDLGTVDGNVRPMRNAYLGARNEPKGGFTTKVKGHSERKQRSGWARRSIHSYEQMHFFVISVLCVI